MHPLHHKFADKSLATDNQPKEDELVKEPIQKNDEVKPEEKQKTEKKEGYFDEDVQRESSSWSLYKANIKDHEKVFLLLNNDDKFVLSLWTWN